MKYGAELIAQLEEEIRATERAQANRRERINNWETDEDDCFISMRVDSRSIGVNRDKIALIKKGGCEWFVEYATLDGHLINAHWCNTRFGTSLRAEMPNGEVVWTRANTQSGLAKKGIKKVLCLRPAWFCFRASGSGMLGVYTGSYVLFPSDVNYATGEDAGSDPIEIRDAE